MRLMFVAAAAALVASAAPAIANAQEAASPAGVYVNLGYGRTSNSGLNFGAIGGRVGYRLNKWVGAEAEGSFGVDDDQVTIGATAVTVKMKNDFGAYAVGFLPVTPEIDVLARVGYGRTKFSASAATGGAASGSDNSWNVGVGGQYHFDGKNGVRLDYTYKDFNDGGHANVWSVVYSRRF